MVESRKPYLRYSISGDVSDRGIAYCVKQAANVFLKTHGFDGHVIEVDASSSKFGAVLELFDNGKYDFDALALNEHLIVSGRLPSRESIRPSIVLKPLACDAIIQINQDSPDHIAYEKSLEQFRGQLKEKDERLKQRDSTIKDLNSVLQERQGRIDEGDGKLSLLEKKIAETQTMQPMQCATARDAVLNGYFREAHDTYMELSIDLAHLEESGNMEFFEKRVGREKVFFAEYVNSIYGTQFRSDKELDKWKKKMEKSDSWQDLEEVKKIEQKKTRYLSGDRVIELVAETNMPDEVLALIRTKMNEGKAKVEGLEREIGAIRDKFEQDKVLAGSLGDARVRYNQLENILENSARRKKAGVTLPVVIEVYQDQPGITLFMPYDDSKCSLENLFYGVIQKNVQGFVPEGTELTRVVKNNASGLTTYLSTNSENPGDQVMILSGKLADEIRENKIFRALGVQTTVTVISDVRTRPLPA